MSWLSCPGVASGFTHCIGVHAAAASATQAIGWTATIGRMLTVYGMSDSGNCYKVKLTLEQLGLRYRWIEVDPVKGETASAAFLAKNPNGKVPTLELENGEFLPESNAILNYLADGTPLLPGQRLARPRVRPWVCFGPDSPGAYGAGGRSIVRITATHVPRRAQLPRLHSRGHRALGVMEH